MANVIEIVINAQDNASDIIENILGGVSDFGAGIARTGAGMMAVAAPFVAGLGVAANAAIGYNEILTNVQAVTGYTAAETEQLGSDILDMAGNSRFAADELANAYYDVAGGVTDVAARNGILEASMHAAQAGAADLGETTSAMISVMNSYGYSAEQAGFASDVLTRTVGMGVGSMGDFASALPQVTGLANSMGIAFEDVAAGAAYLTTQGNTASQASTQLGAMMTTLLSPTADLADIISGLGYESGQAMVDALGLAGAYGAIRDAGGGSFAGIITNTEALRGATALTNEAFNQFSDDFVGGIAGATAAAEEFQMASPAAQLDMLNNSMGALAIEVGGALLPAINDIVQGVRPLVTGFTQWLRANPQVVSTVVAVVGAVAGLGAGLVGIGGIISGVAGGFAALLNPITWIVGAIGLLGTAFATNFMGIRDVVQPVIDNVTAGLDWLLNVGIASFIEDLSQFGLVEAISMAFGGGAAGGESWVEGVIATFLGASGQATGVAREMAVSITGTLGEMVGFVTTTIIPGLQSLVSWFITDGLPLAVGFVTGVVIPAIQSFITFLGNLWTTVQPGLASLADFFITTAMPAIVSFVTETAVPAVQGFITLLTGIWEAISPTLLSVADWFLTSALPSIVSFITDEVGPTIESFTNFITGIWTLGSIALQALSDWWNDDQLTGAIGGVSDVVGAFQTVLSGIWAAVQPVLQPIFDFFTNLLSPVQDVVNMISGIGAQVNGGSITQYTNPAVDYSAQGGITSHLNDSDYTSYGGFGGARAGGGPVSNGMFYLVGENGPEWFAPGMDGTILPNSGLDSSFLQGSSGGSTGAGGGGITINGLTIQANSYAEGQAAADGFNARMTAFEEERNRRG